MKTFDKLRDLLCTEGGKMKLSIALFFLLSTSAFSYEEVWKMGESYLSLLRLEKEKILVSKSCSDKNCQALKILKTISHKNISSTDLAGGKNPGAVLCSKEKRARVIYLKDMSGNENTFCFFNDKSFVSTSTLDIYATKNDGAAK